MNRNHGARRQWIDILKLLNQKKELPIENFNLANYPSKMKKKIKAFTDKQKPKIVLESALRNKQHSTTKKGNYLFSINYKRQYACIFGCNFFLSYLN